MAKKQTTNQVIAELEKQAKAKIEARKLKSLSTDKGMNRHFRKKDNALLNSITTEIESIINKPVYSGFIYSTNVELIVAISNALQFMKGDLRDQIGDGVWSIFDKDMRTDILNAYGRLPYLAEDVTVEVDGQTINVDPEAKARALEGIVGEPAELEALVNELGIDLGLMAEMTVTQTELDKAWKSALSKIKKEEIMSSYKDSLE